MGYCPEEDKRHQTKQRRPLKAKAICKNYLNYSKCNSVAYCARWAFGGCPVMTASRPVGCHLEGGGGCFGTRLLCLLAAGPRALALGAGVLYWDCPTSLCLPPSWCCYHWGCSGLGCGCCHGVGDAGHFTFRAV